jgi:hypothetical protein
VDEQLPQIHIPSFADPEQPWLATRRMLPGHQTRPRGKLPAIFEMTRVTHGRN